MRFVAALFAVAGSLISLVYSGVIVRGLILNQLGSDSGAGRLAIVSLVASVLGLIGAVMAFRRARASWLVLLLAAAGSLIGLLVFLIGVAPATLLAIAAVLALLDSRKSARRA